MIFRSGNRASQAGITLIEMIVTIVILAIALIGISMAIQSGIGRSADTLVQLRSAALAQAYLDEILGKRFDENSQSGGIPPCRASAPVGQQCSQETGTIPPPVFGPDDTETRATYDDVDDYHGLDEGDGGTGPLQDANGDTRSGYANFRIQIDVRYINVGPGEEEEGLGNNLELDDEFDAKLITVSVSYRGVSEPFLFSAYKSNF